MKLKADGNCNELKPEVVSVLQANAEPDMKQTGERLKGLIDSLVECTVQLVADPFAAEQVCNWYCLI